MRPGWKAIMYAAWGALAIAIWGVPLAGWLSWTRLPPAVDPRLELSGRVVGNRAGSSLESWVQERTRDRLSMSVVLAWPRGNRTATLEQLGFVPEVKETIVGLRAATTRAHDCDPIGCWLSWRGLARGGTGVPVVIGLDPAVLEEFLLDLKKTVDTPPIEAKIDFTSGTTSEHRDGLGLEVHEAGVVIERAILGSLDGDIELPVAPIQPSITAETLRSLDTSAVLASYETTFPRFGKNESRAFNVGFAASKLDGHVLLPGRVMSFNAVVGERSLEAGFEEAPEIWEGEMVEGVGGGTCQVASTLHAAALFAGLDIVERYPHSRPSSYVRMGLDATVSWPAVDLRIRNSYPFAVVLRASTEKGRLRIEVLGPLVPVVVTFRTVVVEKYPFEELVELDESLEAGVVVVTQYGLPGYKIDRVITLSYTDGSERIIRDTDKYPPTTHIVAVSPETGYTGLTDAERGIEAAPADEGTLEGLALEERPADFALPAAPDAGPVVEKWKIVNGPFAHPPKPEKLP